jgi:MFS family permease
VINRRLRYKHIIGSLSYFIPKACHMSKPSKNSAFLRLFTISVFIILASIDNSVLDMASSVYVAMETALHTTEIFLGFVNALLIWIVAGVAIWWGYLGDKGNRKKLLLVGTAIWSVSLAFTPLVFNEISWLVVQCVAGIGLACIASVGFSVIVDFVSPEKRGAALGLWGLSQGIGTGLGKGVAAITVTGASNWWFPFIVFSLAGFVMIGFYFFTLDPKRGGTETELKDVVYEYKIKKADLRYILNKKTNILIMLTGIIGQVGWGALTRYFQRYSHLKGFRRARKSWLETSLPGCSRLAGSLASLSVP